MMNTKRLVTIFLFYCFVFLSIGCTEQQKETKNDMKEFTKNIDEAVDKIEESVEQRFLDLATNFIKLTPELSHKLEKKAGFKFSQVILINSETGENKFMIHDEFGLSANENVSEIRNITPISVVGVSGVEIDKKTYESCNYVSFDSETRLICKRGADQPSPGDPTDPIESFPTELATEIERASGINNVGFLLFSDYATGKLKIVSSQNYISFHDQLPKSVSAINNGLSWSVTTYKQNPCCTSIMIGSEKQKVCNNSVLRC
ncbi:hypothetical protein [Nitrosomonas sp.]|uniref:hypothetical protein n=1 Tax=Nitrosomonas sp. TaxID=42353 RepID=UPI0025F3B8F6|nr:hypothetical protein [Nitrosomonas sp.]MBY0484335.1 hypothetical protein [Nitrosomonas sp.]